MERRDFVMSGLAGAAVGLMGSSVTVAQDHKHADGDKKNPARPAASEELKKVADTAYECIRHANACIAECNLALAKGEVDMADCQQAVLSMISVCEATATNATFNLVDNQLLRNLIKVCSEFCDYCADACEPHAEHYTECKNCMDSCQECSDACKAYLKA